MPDREKVIRRLAEVSEYTRAKADIAGVGKGKEIFDSWFRAAEDAIILLRKQETGGWISVKDRLPEEGAYVLLLPDNKYYCIAHYIGDGEWITPGYGGCDAQWWMPLPEKPKEVTTDDP